MDVADVPDASTPPISTTLRRRNSIGATSASLKVPIKRHHPSSISSSLTTTTTCTSSSSSSSSSSSDFELVAIKPTSYTSLRDILPSTATVVQSPKAPSFASSAHSCYEISIRNRLVKQAAWAYLQPMSSSPETQPSFILRLWTRFSDGFLRLIARVFDCLLRSTRLDTTSSR